MNYCNLYEIKCVSDSFSDLELNNFDDYFVF